MEEHINQFLLIDVFLIVIRIDFPLFFLLPCKLSHVCLRNEFLIKTFIIIIIIIIIIINELIPCINKVLLLLLTTHKCNLPLAPLVVAYIDCWQSVFLSKFQQGL